MVCIFYGLLATVASVQASSKDSETHWAFQPVQRPPLPEVSNPDWVRTPLDAFILKQLDSKNLPPSDQADSQNLIRRLYFDLLGIPPSFQDVQNIVHDKRPDAYPRLVDRLLSSPRYGERWGRHWLDVARYSDTKDLVLLYGKDRIRPYAYTYRDYVIRAFNEDLSYPEFVIDQLAADQQNLGRQKWRLAAMGFLTLGRLFDNNLPDIYDDQIDTVTRGFLGLTVSCARCHDHKYDAIPTEDYYSLYGIFSASQKPIDLPLLQDPKSVPGGEDFEKQLSEKKKELQEHIDSQYSEIYKTARERVGDYLMKIAAEKKDPLESAVFFLSLSPDDLRPQFLSRWRQRLKSGGGVEDAVFGIWNRLKSFPTEGFEEATTLAYQKLVSLPEGTLQGQINPLVKKAFMEKRPTTLMKAAEIYGNLIKSVYQKSKLGSEKNNADSGNSPVREQLTSLMSGLDSPFYFPKTQTYLYMSRVPRGHYSGLLQGMDKLAVHSNHAPARAMILEDRTDYPSPRVFVRGNPNHPGQIVPRRFLKVLSKKQRKPFSQGSGRLELAKEIASMDNPLTSRVLVNRVWMHHFGTPLVDTPNDFGFQSNPPTHPDLLDWLTSYFNEKNGSIKQLHRIILLSNTYRQSSRHRPEAAKSDPENGLYWKMNRRRLDLETMRDRLLYATGTVDLSMGGRSTDVAGDPENHRRTVYGLVDRQDVPGLFRTFDFADPSQSAAKRPTTTVPQQALFAMNSSFMNKLARQAVLAISQIGNPETKVLKLYENLLLRKPSSDEIHTAMQFMEQSELNRHEDDKLNPTEQLAQALLQSNEFMFVD